MNAAPPAPRGRAQGEPRIAPAQPSGPQELSDLVLIDALHGGFPLVPRPFAELACKLSRGEGELIARITALLAEGILTRFGPLFQIERAGGLFMLSALEVPEDRLEQVGQELAAMPEVAHNYVRRSAYGGRSFASRLNLWFVLALENGEGLGRALGRIERATGLRVLTFPKEREYFVELRLPLVAPDAPQEGAQARSASDNWPSASANTPCASTNMLRASATAQGEGPPPPCLDTKSEQAAQNRSKPRAPSAGRSLSSKSQSTEGISSSAVWAERAALPDFDRRLVVATQAGLPLTERPYAAVGEALGVGEEVVIDALKGMLSSGLIRRIGALPNHYRLGFVANGMSVWDVSDESVDALGQRVGALAGVSHCYRRSRRPPMWRYNLFAMVHGKTHAQVERQVHEIAQILGPHSSAHDLLYSTALFKKAGLRLLAH